MRKNKGTQFFKTLLSLSVIAISLNAPQLFAQASKPRVNNEKPEKGKQVKRMHPHALKLASACQRLSRTWWRVFGTHWRA